MCQRMGYNKVSLIYSGNPMNSFENNANKEAPPEINF